MQVALDPLKLQQIVCCMVACLKHDSSHDVAKHLGARGGGGPIPSQKSLQKECQATTASQIDSGFDTLCHTIKVFACLRGVACHTETHTHTHTHEQAAYSLQRCHMTFSSQWKEQEESKGSLSCSSASCHYVY